MHGPRRLSLSAIPSLKRGRGSQQHLRWTGVLAGTLILSLSSSTWAFSSAPVSSLAALQPATSASGANAPVAAQSPTATSQPLPPPSPAPAPTSAGAPVISPSTPAGSPATSPATSPVESSPASPAPAENLLAPSTTAAPTPPPPPPRKRVRATSEIDSRDARQIYFSRIYRPVQNPGRIGFGGQIDLAALSPTSSEGGGRMAHIELDFAQRWNYFGYTISAQAMFGNPPLVPETVSVPIPGTTTGETRLESVVHRTNVVVGGGARLNLGRLSLLGIGYLDPQVGYFVGYAPTADAKKNGGKYNAIAPHGPEIRLDAGFVTNAAADHAKWWRTAGVGVGYQIWVGTFKNKQPVTHVMLFGVRYHLQ